MFEFENSPCIWILPLLLSPLKKRFWHSDFRIVFRIEIIAFKMGFHILCISPQSGKSRWVQLFLFFIGGPPSRPPSSPRKKINPLFFMKKTWTCFCRMSSRQTWHHGRSSPELFHLAGAVKKKNANAWAPLQGEVSPSIPYSKYEYLNKLSFYSHSFCLLDCQMNYMYMIVIK